jgi:hypothetical protein
MSAPPRAHPPQEGMEGWVMELQDQEVGMKIHSSATLQSTLVAGRRVRKVGVIWSYGSPTRQLATTRGGGRRTESLEIRG